jgi:hypothetical protein
VGAATGKEVSRRRRPFKSREPEPGLEEVPEHRVSLASNERNLLSLIE